MFHRTLTAFLVGIFGLFLGSPIFSVESGVDHVTLIHERGYDTCTQNIICEVSDDERYVCRDIGEVFLPAGKTVQSVSLGRQDISDISRFSSEREKYTGLSGLYMGIAQAQVEAFAYPFVRITKIQV